jgi:hypothetical protein
MQRAGTLVLVLALAAGATPALASEDGAQPRPEPWYRDALVWENPDTWLQGTVRSLQRLRMQPGRDGTDVTDTVREWRPARRSED